MVAGDAAPLFPAAGTVKDAPAAGSTVCPDADCRFWVDSRSTAEVRVKEVRVAEGFVLGGGCDRTAFAEDGAGRSGTSPAAGSPLRDAFTWTDPKAVADGPKN